MGTPTAGGIMQPMATAENRVAETVTSGRRRGEAVTSMSPPTHEQPRTRGPLRRHPERGLLGGVCAGVAQYSGADVLVVRLVMAMVVVLGGVGFAVYALAWALIPLAPESEGTVRPPGAWRWAAFIVLGLAGALVGLRVSGLHFGELVVWPLIVGVCGMALAWRLTVGATPAPATQRVLGDGHRRAGQYAAPRVVVAAVLVAFASSALLHTFGLLHNLGKEIGAVAIIATTLGLLVGPWFLRLGRSLASERAARIREQERAELAAHLHDSVLQTLALIQKRAGDPGQVAGLARRQERELRRWLLERPDPGAGDSIATALEHAAAEVEELQGVPIEVVTVGDGPLDGSLDAMVQAAREAMTNAAKFAGSERIDLYAEVEPGRVEVYVRDRGVGFDPLAIPTDRRGVRDSIVARMQRHHGSAAVHSTLGEGTEVELVMER
jgi:signal transduction histidine kinase